MPRLPAPLSPVPSLDPGLRPASTRACMQPLRTLGLGRGDAALDLAMVPEEWREPAAAMHGLHTLYALGGLDVFSGTGAMKEAFWRRHVPCASFEKEDDPREDILKLPGISYLFTLLMRMASQGLVVMGPPCKSWVFLASSQTGRSKARGVGWDAGRPLQHTLPLPLRATTPAGQRGLNGGAHNHPMPSLGAGSACHHPPPVTPPG